jgi:hypothetical protein
VDYVLQVPLHFRTNWDSFYLEMLMIAGLLVYSLNFCAGKSKNNKLANAWFTSHRSLLEENFSLVGMLLLAYIFKHSFLKC